jgi:hypothetical protein
LSELFPPGENEIDEKNETTSPEIVETNEEQLMGPNTGGNPFELMLQAGLEQIIKMAATMAENGSLQEIMQLIMTKLMEKANSSKPGSRKPSNPLINLDMNMLQALGMGDRNENLPGND